MVQSTVDMLEDKQVRLLWELVVKDGMCEMSVRKYVRIGMLPGEAKQLRT